jgi:hypothetical protein
MQWRPAPVRELFVEMGDQKHAQHGDSSDSDHDAIPLQKKGVVFVRFQKRE